MTSDAKIGLLLGLVFIFVIAFVINGLPGLHHKDDSNRLTTNMVGLQSNPSGLGANERKVLEQSQPVQDTAAQTEPRYTMTLPQGQQPAADYTPAGPGTEVINSAAPGMPDTATVQLSPAVAPVAPVGAQPTVSAEPAIKNPARTAPAAKPQPAIKPEPAKSVAANTYVVQEGDSLSSIAKEVYGEEQGNKLANINAIFEANRKTVASIDSLQVGQKLIIPPVSTIPVQGRVEGSKPTLAGSNTPTPSSVLAGPGFAKADSVGSRHLPAGTTNTAKPVAAAKPENIYVVKEGDSLWRIAADRLGDGNRYREIVRLNSPILASEDDLQAGMQLKMPAK